VVDGATVKTPVTLKAGKHVVTGSKKGYEGQGTSVVVKAGETEKLYFPLKKLGKKDCGKFLKRCE
jgi:hypothetical protein